MGTFIFTGGMVFWVRFRFVEHAGPFWEFFDDLWTGSVDFNQQGGIVSLTLVRIKGLVVADPWDYNPPRVEPQHEVCYRSPRDLGRRAWSVQTYPDGTPKQVRLYDETGRCVHRFKLNRFGKILGYSPYSRHSKKRTKRQYAGVRHAPNF